MLDKQEETLTHIHTLIIVSEPVASQLLTS